MIALLNECLLFQLATGECVPCSAEMISVEIAGGQDRLLDPDVLRHAAASVFHYFKTELLRESVTVGEFSIALEKVLRQLGFTLQEDPPAAPAGEMVESDLRILACQAAQSLELAAPRTAQPVASVTQGGAFPRPARLRQATGRRPPLDRTVRAIAGANCRLPPRMPHRRPRAGPLLAGRGMSRRPRPA
jgi:hypothetical protein